MAIFDYKTGVACSGESKWYIWVPFGVREVAVCEASENMHPIGLRSMFLVRISIGLHTLLGFLVDNYREWFRQGGLYE